MHHLIPVIIMICAGTAVALQPSINARLAERIGLLGSACISFSIGTLVLLVAVLVSGRLDVKNLAGTPWWEWTGGILGAFFVSATILSVPRIGTAATMAVAITAQLVTALILDHWGIFGYGGIQFDLKRALGVSLLAVGAWLIVRH
jgi:bacterial/archaeal transporter family-2 protein